MKAAVLSRPRSVFSLEEVPTPKPRGFEVLVRVRAAGLCHTDVHLWEGHYGPLKAEERGVKYPLIMGHEIAGEVAEVGELVERFKVGDKVLVYPWIGCGTCKACLRGEEHLCVYGTKPLGILRPGGFAEYVLVPHQRYLVKVSDDVDLIKAAILPCAGITAYSAVKKAGLSPGDYVIIIGIGGVGHIAVQLAKKLYAARVIAVDTRDKALEMATRIGADYTINPSKVNVVEEVKKITDNIGADTAIDFVANTETSNYAFMSLKRGGRLVLVGLGGEHANFVLPLIPLRNIDIRGSYVGSIADLMEVLELLRRGLIDPVISTYPLSQINEVFDKFRTGQIVGRVVFIP